MRRFVRSCLPLITLTSLLSFGPLWAQPTPLQPLSDADRAPLAAIQPDPPPSKLARGSHYFRSNEHRHDVWAPYATQLRGGAYVGVGTDQNYLLAGWSRPELLILMDFDSSVADLNKVYAVFFQQAATPDDFIQLWGKGPAAEKQAKIWLTEAYGEPRLQEAVAVPSKSCGKECKRLFKTYRTARKLVFSRLKQTQKQYAALGTPCFLTDTSQYAYLADLARTGRMYSFRGDLTQHGLGQIAAALNKMGMKLNTIYLSNAERYFTYRTVGKNASYFAEEFSNLPFADTALVLRTWATGPKWLYTYYVQRPADFIQRLADPNLRRFAQIGKAYNQLGLTTMRRAIDRKISKFAPWSKLPYALLDLGRPVQESILTASGVPAPAPTQPPAAPPVPAPTQTPPATATPPAVSGARLS